MRGTPCRQHHGELAWLPSDRAEAFRTASCTRTSGQRWDRGQALHLREPKVHKPRTAGPGWKCLLVIGQKINQVIDVLEDNTNHPSPAGSASLRCCRAHSLQQLLGQFLTGCTRGHTTDLELKRIERIPCVPSHHARIKVEVSNKGKSPNVWKPNNHF